MPSPTERETHNFMFGYALHIRALSEEDVQIHKVDLGDSLMEDCVAVDGIDLGDYLAAVVDAVKHKLIWSDADAIGTPVPVNDEQGVADAVLKLTSTFLPVEASSVE